MKKIIFFFLLILGLSQESFAVFDPTMGLWCSSKNDSILISTPRDSTGVVYHSGYFEMGDTLFFDDDIWYYIPPDSSRTTYPPGCHNCPQIPGIMCIMSVSGGENPPFNPNVQSVCSGLSIGTTTRFADSRDGETYKAVLMPDRRCWMAENLRYRKGLNNPVFSNQPVTTNTNALQNTYYCPGHGPLVTGTPTTQSDPLACEYWGCLYPWWSAMMVRNDGVAPYFSDTVATQGLCPPGWHLPSDKEWGNLFDAVERDKDPSFVSLHASILTKSGYYGTITNNKVGSYLKSANIKTGDCKECEPQWTSGSSTDDYGFSILPAGCRDQNGSAYLKRGANTYFWTSSKSSTANYGIYRGFADTEVRVGRWDNYGSYGLSVRCVEGEYAFIPEISLCVSGDVYEVAVKNFQDCSSFIFNIDGVDQPEGVESYRFFAASDVGKTVKVKCLLSDGWVSSDGVTIGASDDTIPDAPALSVNTNSGTAYNATITTTATAVSGCIVNWLDLPPGGAISSINKLTYSGTSYSIYATSVNTTTGCVSSDRAMSTVLLYSGAAAARTLRPGTYQIECWGASGGAGLNNGERIIEQGGLGAHVKGRIKITTPVAVYVHVGGKGSNSSGQTGGSGGYNGGGKGGDDTYETATIGEAAGGGGGASDIRLSSGAWNNATGLRSRIMVAAGGSGGYASHVSHGGTSSVTVATGTTNQTSGNAFGVGGAGEVCTINNCAPGSGGGGGYYGGWGGRKSATGNALGSGGSSFISGVSWCNAVNASGVHTGQPNHYSGLVFTGAEAYTVKRNGHGTVVIVRTGN